MEEQKETYTKKEVMDMVDKIHKGYHQEIVKCNKIIEELNGTLSELNILLKIVNTKDVFSVDFINRCAARIELIMTPSTEKETSKNDETR